MVYEAIDDNLQWKMTTNGRLPQMEDNLKWRKNSTGRQPQPEDKNQELHTFEEVSETQNVGHGRIQYFLMSVISSY